jgi:hypothetical protein
MGDRFPSSFVLLPGGGERFISTQVKTKWQRH